jgi:lysophospholipase L1-like esterase
MRAGLVVFGLLAALASAALALFTLGETEAVAIGLGVLVVAVAAAAAAGPRLGRTVLVLVVLTLAGSLIVAALGTLQILAAVVGASEGPVAPPNPVALASAEDKIDASSEETGFRLELTETELNAVLQDNLGDERSPFEQVTIDILNAVGEPGRIGFTGHFKRGSLAVEGEMSATTEGGRIVLELLDADVGIFRLPGVARNAIEDMIADVADLNRALAEQGAEVQQVVIGDDRVVVTGVSRGDATIDSAAALAAFGELGTLGVPDLERTERYPPGTADGFEAPGDPAYLALGDSLAAAVGVEDPADGYVSRFHRHISTRDGVAYGMLDLGVAGETSGTLLNGGQLDRAIDYGTGHDVAYITIDIGANDLLGHLSSPDCSEDLTVPACTDRIEGSLTAYALNVDDIFGKLANHFPDATVVVLLAYNPFSLGFEDQVAFEARSNSALERLNAIAADAAGRYGFLVADGFTPMRGTAAATTHMVDVPPDIHPNALGYDILTGALADALEES